MLQTVSLLMSFLSLVPCGLSLFFTDCLPNHVLLRSFLLHADRLLTHVLQHVLFLAGYLRSLQTISLLVFFRLCSLQTVLYRLSPYSCSSDFLCSLQTVSVPCRLSLFLTDRLPTHGLLQSFLHLTDHLPTHALLQSFLFLADRLATHVLLLSFLLHADRLFTHVLQSILFLTNHLVPYRSSLYSCPPSVFLASCRQSIYSCPSVQLVLCRPSHTALHFFSLLAHCSL